jgi:hypothetical protein
MFPYTAQKILCVTAYTLMKDAALGRLKVIEPDGWPLLVTRESVRRRAEQLGRPFCET